jgi:hypothetical protein
MEFTPSCDANRVLSRIRLLLALFIFGLIVSGVTAFPLETEVKFLTRFLSGDSTLGKWLFHVRDALVSTNQNYPFMAYGTDWLAFAHLVIAVAFIGPWRDPVRNIWVIEFGMISCVMVLPLALIAGTARGIPFWWRLIDCSFGLIGILPLWFAWKLTRTLAAGQSASK